MPVRSNNKTSNKSYNKLKAVEECRQRLKQLEAENNRLLDWLSFLQEGAIFDWENKKKKMKRNIPKKFRGIYDKAKNGKSRKMAIRAFCLECCSYSSKEVKLCTDEGCPLYKYRLTG